MATAWTYCPFCKQRHRVLDDSAGLVRVCDNCGEKFKVEIAGGCLGRVVKLVILAVVIVFLVALAVAKMNAKN